MCQVLFKHLPCVISFNSYKNYMSSFLLIRKPRQREDNQFTRSYILVLNSRRALVFNHYTKIAILKISQNTVQRYKEMEKKLRGNKP